MELDEGWMAPDGTPMRLRRLRRQDAPALGALLEALPPRDRLWRFHGAVNGLSQAQLERLTGADGTHHVALAVTAEAPERELLLAEARWVRDETGTAGEVALAVAPGWRRRGIGERCMRALLRAASARNLDWLYGTVLADNAPMLALIRRFGFQCGPKRGDRSLMLFETRVSAAMQ